MVRAVLINDKHTLGNHDADAMSVSLFENRLIFQEAVPPVEY